LRCKTYWRWLESASFFKDIRCRSFFQTSDRVPQFNDCFVNKNKGLPEEKAHDLRKSGCKVLFPFICNSYSSNMLICDSVSEIHTEMTNNMTLLNKWGLQKLFNSSVVYTSDRVIVSSGFVTDHEWYLIFVCYLCNNILLHNESMKVESALIQLCIPWYTWPWFFVEHKSLIVSISLGGPVLLC